MSSTDILVTAFLSVLCIGAVFLMAQVAMLDVNPNAGTVYPCENGILNGIVNGSPCSTSTNATIRTISLPSTDATASPTTGNIITDTLTSGKNWLIESVGLGYIYAIIKAPAVFLNAAGVPQVVSTSIAAIFYFICIFLLVSWLIGR